MHAPQALANHTGCEHLQMEWWPVRGTGNNVMSRWLQQGAGLGCMSITSPTAHKHIASNTHRTSVTPATNTHATRRTAWLFDRKQQCVLLSIAPSHQFSITVHAHTHL